MSTSKSNSIPTEPKLYLIRGQRVILDSDLAKMYGVATKRFNEAFKRNLERFPEDFAFQLTQGEAQVLRSQIATSKILSVTEDLEMRGGRRNSPWVFNEHGALMAATILKSDQAVRLSVFVVRAFVRMREQIADNQAILKRLAEIDLSLLAHDSILRDIYDKLMPLLEPPPDPASKRKLGFHRER
ncbi:MAG: uncharacterized protein K0Q91_457 [Fibrobacteria bacterium]|jgi:hypothetical protein|nr:uncharacterized protein [Fibrobacteria bacterium]